MKAKGLIKLYRYIFLAFVASIPFEELFAAIPNILLIMLGLLSVFVIDRNEVKSLFKDKVFLTFLLLISAVVTLSMIRETLIHDFFIVEKISLIPIIYFLAKPIKPSCIARTFTFSTLLAIIISLFKITAYYYSEGNFNFKDGEIINDMLISERFYLGFCSILSLTYLLSTVKSENLIRSTHKLLVCLLIILFLMIIAGRLAILMAFIITACFIILRLNKKQGLFVSFAITILTCSIFLVNKDLTRRFFHSDDIYTSSFYEKIKRHEPRYVIWLCSKQIFDNDYKPLIGNGFNKLESQLLSCYETNIIRKQRKSWFITSKFNTHNQYLDMLLGTGIIGLIFLIILLSVAFYQSNKSFISLALLSSLVLVLMLENLFHRQIGCYLFVLVMILANKNFEGEKTK